MNCREKMIAESNFSWIPDQVRDDKFGNLFIHLYSQSITQFIILSSRTPIRDLLKLFIHHFLRIIRIIMIESIVVASSLFGMSEEAKEMGAKFAAMKAKTHQTLTAAKDISSLVARIDKDLLALSKKKQELFALKNSLLAKKNELLFLIELKKTDFSRLQAAYNTTQADIKLQVESLNALETQKSITTEVQAVDHLPSRATLLAQAFEKKQMRENIAVEVEHKFEEDFYG